WGEPRDVYPRMAVSVGSMRPIAGADRTKYCPQARNNLREWFQADAGSFVERHERRNLLRRREPQDRLHMAAFGNKHGYGNDRGVYAAHAFPSPGAAELGHKRYHFSIRQWLPTNPAGFFGRPGGQ